MMSSKKKQGVPLNFIHISFPTKIFEKYSGRSPDLKAVSGSPSHSIYRAVDY